MSRQSLGFLLHVRRKKLGLKQEDVARRVGISQSCLSKYERGRSEPPFREIGMLWNLYRRETFWDAQPGEVDMYVLWHELVHETEKTELANIRKYWGSSSKERKKMREGL